MRFPLWSEDTKLPALPLYPGGFRVIYGYTQSDEISLLLHRDEASYCYWMLRKAGESAGTATEKLDRLSVGDKNELLYQQANINFNDLPSWQKRGIGLYWESYQKEATNPQAGEKVFAMRRQINVDMELSMKDDYSNFIRNLVLREHPDL